MTRSLAVALLFLALAAPVYAQDASSFRVVTTNPGLPTENTQAVVHSTGAPVNVFNRNISGGYYGAPGAYTPYGVYSPVGGALSGAADLVNANGEYLNQVQQSRQAMNQADLGKLQVNRAIYEQQAYERKNTITAEQVRQFERQRELDRSRQDPPKNEIWSGKALNELLQDVQNMQKSGLQGPSVPLDPDMLRHINVTDGTTYGSAGIFKDLPLAWPLELQTASFKKDRDAIDALVGKMASMAAKGRVELASFDAMNNALASMRNNVKAQISTMSPSENIRAKRYLNQLQDSLSIFRDPNVANYFNGKWQAQGSTVGELIAYMTQNGLTLAPANNGDESYYQAFYQSLRTYDYNLFRVAGGEGATPR
jgi:hypothetical protein